MRVYLSHPYGGKPENKEKAARLASMYREIWDKEGKKNWEIVNPLAYFEPLAGTVDENTILRVAVNLMLTCDGILYAPGWKKSRGCRYERMIAKAKGIPRIYLNKEDVQLFLSLAPRFKVGAA